MNQEKQGLQKLFVIASLVAILAGGLGLRLLGSGWPPLHPDEHKLTKWVKRTSIQAFVTDQVYPNGFFVMFRPIQWLAVGRLDKPPTPGAASPATDNLDRRLLLLGRAFNAWLGAAAAFLAFLMARAIFKSSGPGLAAAWAVAFHPFFVEHCHYLETEAAMVFTLFLGLLAWTVYLSGRRRWAIAAAALLSGFAAGTKFTSLLLLPLAFLPLIHGIEPKGRGRPWAWTIAGLAAFAAGFAVSNIGLVAETEWFFDRLAADSAGTFGESREVVGAAFGRPMALFMHKLRWLGKYLAAWGFVPLLAWAAGMTLWFRTGRARHFTAVALGFPALFAVFLLFKAPWVRMQETFNLLPAFAMAAAALLSAALALMRSGALFRRALGWAGAILLILAGLTMLRASARRAELFAWQDSRFAAGEWLKLHMNTDRALGLEAYTKAQYLPGTPVPNTVHLGRAEDHMGPGGRIGQSDYVLRNETFPDRGRFDPFTGRHYMPFEERRMAFLRAFRPLRHWSPCPPEDEASFAFVNPELTLYGRAPAPIPTLCVATPLPRPIIITAKPLLFSPIGHSLGAAWAAPLTSKGATAAIGGPMDHPGPVYAVIFTENEPANVKITGRGGGALVQVAQWSAVAVELKRGAFRGRWAPFESIHARTVSGSRHEKGRTYLTLAFTPDEALWLTHWLGSRMKALEFMDQSGLNADFVNGGTNGRRGMARLRATDHGFRRSARQAHAEIEAALQASPESIVINGIDGRTFEDFSRINGVLATNAFSLAPGPDGAAYMCRTGFPALMPPGNWPVRLELRASPPAGAPPDGGRAQLSIAGPGGAVAWQGPAPASGEWQAVVFTWASKSHAPFELLLSAPVPMEIECRQAEVSWPLRGQLENARTLIEESPAPREGGGLLNACIPHPI